MCCLTNETIFALILVTPLELKRLVNVTLSSTFSSCDAEKGVRYNTAFRKPAILKVNKSAKKTALKVTILRFLDYIFVVHFFDLMLNNFFVEVM